MQPNLTVIATINHAQRGYRPFGLQAGAVVCSPRADRRPQARTGMRRRLPRAIGAMPAVGALGTRLQDDGTWAACMIATMAASALATPTSSAASTSVEDVTRKTKPPCQMRE